MRLAAFNGRDAARIVCLSTAPLWVMQIVALALVEDESPAFIVMTGVAPLTATLVWLIHRRRRLTGPPRADPLGLNEIWLTKGSAGRSRRPASFV